MIRHSETAKMSKTSCFFILGGQLASSGGGTLFSDSLKLQPYQHKGQLNLLKVEVYLNSPHLNITLWLKDESQSWRKRIVNIHFKRLCECPIHLYSHNLFHILNFHDRMANRLGSHIHAVLVKDCIKSISILYAFFKDQTVVFDCAFTIVTCTQL